MLRRYSVSVKNEEIKLSEMKSCSSLFLTVDPKPVLCLLPRLQVHLSVWDQRYGKLARFVPTVQLPTIFCTASFHYHPLTLL